MRRTTPRYTKRRERGAEPRDTEPGVRSAAQSHAMRSPGVESASRRRVGAGRPGRGERRAATNSRQPARARRRGQRARERTTRPRHGATPARRAKRKPCPERRAAASVGEQVHTRPPAAEAAERSRREMHTPAARAHTRTMTPTEQARDIRVVAPGIGLALLQLVATGLVLLFAFWDAFSEPPARSAFRRRRPRAGCSPRPWPSGGGSRSPES